jgi:hypothetical protein
MPLDMGERRHRAVVVLKKMNQVQQKRVLTFLEILVTT